MKSTKNLLIVMLALGAISLISFKQIENENYSTQDVKQMVADWERAKTYTLAYLNAANDEVVNFKPTAEMRTFGQQMLHLSEANYGLASAATGKATTVTFGSLEKSDQYKTKAALTKAVTESYDFVIAAVKEMNEQKLAESVNVFNHDMTKGVALQKVFEHQTHHRGQTTVYLRLKGLTPPNEMLF